MLSTAEGTLLVLLLLRLPVVLLRLPAADSRRLLTGGTVPRRCIRFQRFLMSLSDRPVECRRMQA